MQLTTSDPYDAKLMVVRPTKQKPNWIYMLQLPTGEVRIEKTKILNGRRTEAKVRGAKKISILTDQFPLKCA